MSWNENGAPAAAVFCLCLARVSVLLEAPEREPKPGSPVVPRPYWDEVELEGLRRWMMKRIARMGPRMKRTRLLLACFWRSMPPFLSRRGMVPGGGPLALALLLGPREMLGDEGDVDDADDGSWDVTILRCSDM